MITDEIYIGQAVTHYGNPLIIREIRGGEVWASVHPYKPKTNETNSWIPISELRRK